MKNTKMMLFRIIKYILIVIISYFLIKVFIENYNKMRGVEFTTNYALLVLATLLMFITYFLFALCWHFILDGMDIKSNIRFDTKNWFYSQMYKYIPGSLGLVVSRYYLYKKNDCSKIKMAIAIIAETGTLLFTGFIIGIFYLVREIGMITFPVLFTIILISIIIFLLIIIMRFSREYIKKIIGFFIKKNMDNMVINYKKFNISLILFLFCWLLFGISMYLFVTSFIELPKNFLFTFIGINSLAIAISIITFISPSGIGVREGILILFLKEFVQMPTAIFISIISRIWLVSIEVIIFLGIYSISKISQKKKKKV